MKDPSTGPAAERDYERQLREMNEALLVSSVRQHELAEQAEQAAAALRESETTLRQQNKQLSAFLETSAIGLHRVGPDGTILWANEAELDMLGYARDEYIGHHIADFHADQDLIADILARLNRGEKLRDYEARMKCGDGSIKSVLIDSSVLWDEDRFIHTQCFTRDITERKRAEEALRESEERYRGIVNQSIGGIAETDATGRFTTVNNRYCKITGYAREELLNLRMQEITHAEDLPRNLELVEKLVGEGTPFEIEKRYVRKDNSIVWVHNSVSAIRDASGGVQSLVAVSIDITERVRLERQAQEQSEALADLNRRKDEFLAMLSHELRNPLAPIINAVHLLRHQRDDNPIQQQARAIIERQAGQLARIIDDLMEVSRITTGKIKLHLERLDIRGIVEHAVESVRPLIDQRMHELSVSLPDEPIWLYADAARLEQVIVNLLNNAAKYMDKGGYIWMSVGQEGDEAVLRVRDTGIGILPEILPRIFDLFTQADLSLDRSQGGLGIGLTVVQRLVGMHGGTVEANSAGVGKGSEFIVRLPVAPSPARQSEPSSIETAEPPGARWRVLVADDNVDSANVTVLLLRELGHEAQVAYSGATALEAADEYQPNLVLLDIGMPEMDGYEVARRLRQHPQLRNAWVVAITGYGQESDRQRSKEAGFDYHLVKPVGAQKLQELLRMLTTQERSGE
ncbi:MAG TPA: PAS domain S-box protein [Blastocatellia bacterium]|nr:PAS domain S-box protein [Blastocatellia bacterium]